MIRVLVVDDHDLVRTGITRMLADIDGLQVVGEADSGESALKLAMGNMLEVTNHALVAYVLPREQGATVRLVYDAGRFDGADIERMLAAYVQLLEQMLSPERRLGTTVASLGDPSQPGFWVKTPLVQSETDGRIVNPANGKSAKVRLIPLGGAGGGSQVSLPALQLIGVSLTDLPTLEIYSG